MPRKGARRACGLKPFMDSATAARGLRVAKKWVEKCVEWSRREVSKRRQALALALGVAVFMLTLPALLIAGGRRLDSTLGVSGLLRGVAWRVVGVVAGSLGWAFAAWSAYVQYAEGEGTPVPSAPTRRLITSGPYRYCRNPMALGTLLFYLGLALVLGIASMVLLTAVLFTFLFLFIKLCEERELEARFGEEYRRYRERTPFLIPKIRLGSRRNRRESRATDSGRAKVV